MEERLDGLFTTAAQQCKGIDEVLETFFGFLRRKTDFYIGEKSVDVCKELVLKHFMKHAELSEETRNERQRENRLKDEERRRQRVKQQAAEAEESKRFECDRAATAAYNKSRDYKEGSGKNNHASSCSSTRSYTSDVRSYSENLSDKGNRSHPKVEEVLSDDDIEGPTPSARMTAKTNNEVTETGGVANGTTKGTNAKLFDLKEGDKAVVDETPQSDEDGDNSVPPIGNGGSTDRYTWTQSLLTVEIFIPLPPQTLSKDVKVLISASKLYVGLKNQEPIIDGYLHARVKADDCVWTLEDRKLIRMVLEKFDGMCWWNCVVSGDAEIDTKKIVPENSKLSDLDGETRSTVEKMMFDQRQKAAGKPTSDQLKQHDMLEKFKKAHPEMDFSNAKINWGN